MSEAGHFAIADPASAADPVTVIERRNLNEDGSVSIRRPLRSVFSAIKTHLSEISSLVLHIAAATPGEGTSTVARELAHQAGQAPWCRTLLLDGNPGGNDQSAHFGLTVLPRVGKGTQDPARIETVRIRFRHARFDLAGVAIGGTQDADQIEPAALRGLYDALRRTYTLVIVDCPPILASADTAVLSNYADGVLLVVAAERTRISVVGRARQDVEDAGGDVKGVILNRRRQYIPNSSTTACDVSVSLESLICMKHLPEKGACLPCTVLLPAFYIAQCASNSGVPRESCQPFVRGCLSQHTRSSHGPATI